MILRDITLVNIGAYRGYNEFNLSTTTEKPVILIGGENGAGKTTFLNAIKLGIFGAYSFGFKTENAEYYKYVSTLLNHEAVRIKENNFSIAINFSITEGFKTIDYNLKRKWQINDNGRPKENVYLKGNNILYTAKQTDIFMDKLKETMPPQILDLCLFDGEEIAKIISENRLSGYIEKVAKVAFNLDLFETLELDLDKYSKQTLDMTSLKKNEKELLDLEHAIELKRNQLQVTQSELFTQAEKYRILLDDFNMKKKTFKNFGGLVKSEYEQTLREINELEMKKQGNNEQVKKFVSTLLPFYLIPGLLTQTHDQIQKENDSILYNQLDQLLDTNKMTTLSKNLKFKDTVVLKDAILNVIQPDTTTESLHFASFAESSLVDSIFSKISSSDELAIHLNYLEKNREISMQLKKLREKLKTHERNTEFNEMLLDIENTAALIQRIETHITASKQSSINLKAELENLLEQEHSITQSIRNMDKSESSFIHSKKIIDLSKKFRTLQVGKKLLRVQIKASKMLQRIFRKENYISSIHINPETYEVTLKDQYKNLVEKRTLSAGEKEILLISIIWAIFSTSDKKVPFIFDTLLGRLDKTHKAAVLTEFIPKSGTQAIVLSTDSEVDQLHYNLLAPFISHAYRLEFNAHTQKTTINNGYFVF